MLSPSSAGHNPNLSFNQAGFPVGINSSDYFRWLLRMAMARLSEFWSFFSKAMYKLRCKMTFFPVSPWGWASLSLSPQGTQQAMGDRHPSHCSLLSWKAPKFGEKGCDSSCRGHWELVLSTFWERSPGAGAAATCTPTLLPLLTLGLGTLV